MTWAKALGLASQLAVPLAIQFFDEVVALVSILGRRRAFTMAFAAWWISRSPAFWLILGSDGLGGSIVSQLRYSLNLDASRGDSILPTKKL